MKVEDEIFHLKEQLSDIRSEINDLQELLQTFNSTQTTINKNLNDTSTNLLYNILDTKGSGNTRMNELNESAETTAVTLDTVMDTVIPAQAENIDEVTETVDTLMTEIIPMLMG